MSEKKPTWSVKRDVEDPDGPMGQGILITMKWKGDTSKSFIPYNSTTYKCANGEASMVFYRLYRMIRDSELHKPSGLFDE